MSRRSNKAVVEILASSSRTNETSLELDRKITLATEGFTTTKFCELTLKDRNRLSKENALIVCDYIIAMKREINPRLNTIRTTIQFLSELSKSVGIAQYDRFRHHNSHRKKKKISASRALELRIRY
jgi:hypothetical protein